MRWPQVGAVPRRRILEEESPQVERSRSRRNRSRTHPPPPLELELGAIAGGCCPRCRMPEEESPQVGTVPVLELAQHDVVVAATGAESVAPLSPQ